MLGILNIVATDSPHLPNNAPRTAITQIESGNRAVSTLELSRLAARYRVPIARFFDVDAFEEDDDLLVVLHR